MSTIPLSAGPDAKVALRSVANIARLAIGPTCTDPDHSSPWVFGPPPADYFDGGTPNQKMLVRVWHYGWALRALSRTSPEMDTIRNTLLDFIDRQRTLGHFAILLNGNEELTSSHYQLWSGALAAAYLYAVADGGELTWSSEGTTREFKVRDAARRWWADELALYRRIHTNDEIDAPGGREYDTGAVRGTNPLRDDIHRLLRGDMPNQARNCNADRYYTSSFVMQALKAKGVPKLGQPVGTETPSPKLYDTLCLYRDGNDWTLIFPKMRGVVKPLYWVQFRSTASPQKYYATPLPSVSKPQSYRPGIIPDRILGVVGGAADCPKSELLDQWSP